VYREREEGTVLNNYQQKGGRKCAVKLESISINIGKIYVEIAG